MAKYIYKHAGYVASNLVRQYCSFVKRGVNENYGGMGALVGAGLGGGLGYFLNSASKNRWLSALAGAGVGGAAGYGIGRNIPVKSVATSPKATPPSSGAREVDPPQELVDDDPTLKGTKVMVRPGPPRPIGGKPVNNGSPVATTEGKPVLRKKTHMIPPPIRPYTLKLENPRTNQVESVVLDPASVKFYNKLDPLILQNPQANFVLEHRYDSDGKVQLVPCLNLESPQLNRYAPEMFASVIAKGNAQGINSFLQKYREEYNPDLATFIPIQQEERIDSNGNTHIEPNMDDLAARNLVTLMNLYANAGRYSSEFLPYSRFVNTKAYTPADVEFIRQNGRQLYYMMTYNNGVTRPSFVDPEVYDRWNKMITDY